MKKVVSTIITIVLLMSVSVVMAEILPALELERNGTGYALASNRTYGWEFSVTEDLAVVGLGIFDLFDDGLDFSHEIGIWHLGELAYSTTIPVGSEETVLIDQFRYIDTDPFWLAVGETYVIGACGLGDPYVGNDGSARITTIPSITYQRTLITESGAGFTLPTLERDFYNFGPNFLVIPEPMTLMVFGLGAVVLRKRR